MGFAAFFATYGFSGRVLQSVASESRALLGATWWSRPTACCRTGSPGQGRVRCLPSPPLRWSTTSPPWPAAARRQHPSTRLVEMRAVAGDYPLAGRLEATRQPRPPLQGTLCLRAPWPRPGASLPPRRGATGDEALLAQTAGPAPGGRHRGHPGRPPVDDNQQASAFSLGPRVLLDLETARDLGLVTARARLSARILALLKPGEAPGTGGPGREGRRGPRLPRAGASGGRQHPLPPLPEPHPLRPAPGALHLDPGRHGRLGHPHELPGEPHPGDRDPALPGGGPQHAGGRLRPAWPRSCSPSPWASD